MSTSMSASHRSASSSPPPISHERRRSDLLQAGILDDLPSTLRIHRLSVEHALVGSAFTDVDEAKRTSGASKLTRSASSNASASQDSSSPISVRPPSMRSVSGSVAGPTTSTSSVGGAATASTASPLDTPGDGPMDDPMALAGKRAMTASPNAFPSIVSASDAAKETREDDEGAETRTIDDQLTSDSQSSRPWVATVHATNTTSSTEEDASRELATPHQQHAVRQRKPDAVPAATWAAQSGQSITRSSALDRRTILPNERVDLSSLAEGIKLNETVDDTEQRSSAPLIPVDSHLLRQSNGTGVPAMQSEENAPPSELRREEHKVQPETHHGYGAAYPYTSNETSGFEASINSNIVSPHAEAQHGHASLHPASFSSHLVHHHHYPLPHQQHMPTAGGPSFASHHAHPQYHSTILSPATPSSASYPSSGTRGPLSTLQQVDTGMSLNTSAYDAFRSPASTAAATNVAADPYAAMYSMPGQPPSLPSSSTPQSPTFGPHVSAQHAMSDSSMYMYPYGTHQAGVPPGFGGMMATARPPMQGSFIAGAPAASAPPLMMHGLAAQQSPVMMTAGGALTASSPGDRQTRRDSLLSSNTAHHSMSPHFVPNAWPSSPSSNVGMGGVHSTQAFVHGHSPSWPAGDQRSYAGGGGMVHRRMLSGPFQGPPPVSFVQQPVSPPSLGRQFSTGGRSMHSRTPSSLSFSSSYGRNTAADGVQRSALLEEFRNRQHRGRRFELADIRGAVVEFSSDQHGSRFTQEKLTTATEEDLQMVFVEVLPHARTLMIDVFGNYVVQKLIEHGTTEMRSQLVEQIVGKVLELSTSTYGCRVVQRALDFIEPAEKMLLANELKEHVLHCVRDQNANHVIQKILERVSPTTQVDFIPSSFTGHVYSLAAHCYSCRVLQRIFEHCQEEQKRPLMEELMQGVQGLIHDQYGNYVIQWVLRNADRADKDRVIELAKGNILHLSKHKFASNVVEQIIAGANQEDRYAFTEEIMQVVEGEPLGLPVAEKGNREPVYAAEMMMRDQYGNYVLQRFLEHADGAQKQRLIALIKRALTNVKRSHGGTYTKHLAAIERLLETNVVRSNAGTMTNVAAPMISGNAEPHAAA